MKYSSLSDEHNSFPESFGFNENDNINEITREHKTIVLQVAKLNSVKISYLRGQFNPCVKNERKFMHNQGEEGGQKLDERTLNQL